MAGEPLEAVVVGDVFINRKYPKTAAAEVRGVFESADIRIGNLESSVSDEGDQGDLSAPVLRSGPENLDAVVELFDLLSMANNHTMDFGAESLIDTIETLEDHGIGVAGAGRTRQEAEAVVSTEVEGTEIGLVAFEATQATAPLFGQARPDRGGMNVVDVSPLYPDPHVAETHAKGLSSRDVATVIENGAAQVDVLLAMFHFGTGYEVTTPQRHLAEVAAESGADAVIGAHAHVPQGVGLHDGVPILYGLGHFFWDSFADMYPIMDEYSFSRETALAKLMISEDRVTGVELYPGYINENDQPTVLDPADDRYDEIAAKIVDVSDADAVVETQDHLEIPL